MSPVPVNRETVLAFHQGGKVGVRLTKPLKTQNDLCLAYTPGVAHAVKEIAAKPDSVFDYTAKRSLVAVVSDGTAILGLGDLGAAASIPVMEGKAVLFKAFGDVDAWPVPLAHCRRDGADTGKTDPQRVIDAVLALAPMYGGINLEDIAAPACFEIEDRLDALLDIPVFHDDQWGTAVITLSGLLNYRALVPRDVRIRVDEGAWRRASASPICAPPVEGSCHVRHPRVIHTGALASTTTSVAIFDTPLARLKRLKAAHTFSSAFGSRSRDCRRQTRVWLTIRRSSPCPILIRKSGPTSWLKFWAASCMSWPDV